MPDSDGYPYLYPNDNTYLQIPVVKGKTIRRVLFGPFADSAKMRAAGMALLAGGPEGSAVRVRVTEAVECSPKTIHAAKLALTDRPMVERREAFMP